MAYAPEQTRKAQGGLETTPGTAVAATFIWPGPVEWINDESVQVEVEEDDGKFFPSGRNYVPRKGATWEMAETVATFETLPYVFCAAIESVVTGTPDAGTGASGRIYQFDFGTNAGNTVKTLTWEVGDSTDVDEIEYSFVEEFTLSGAEGEGLMVSATWRGRQATDASFTAGQAKITPLEEIPFSTGAIWIDTTTLGTSQKTGTWKGFSMNVDTGQKALWTGDGNASPYFSAVKADAPVITGEFTFEHDATGLAEIDAAKAGTLRFIRMKWEGSSFTTAGTVYSKHTLKIDMKIMYDEIPMVDRDDGDDVVTLGWHAVQGVDPQIIVVNTVAAL